MLLDKLLRLVLVVKRVVEVGRVRGELRRAGVNHFVNGKAALRYLLSRNALDSAVEVAVFLCGIVLLLRKLALCKPLFKLDKVTQLFYEPLIYLCYAVDSIDGNAALERLEHAERAVYVNVLELFKHLVVRKLRERLFGHGVHAKLY